MNTIAIVRELADERSLTFFKLSQICDVSHSTLKNSERRGQLLLLIHVDLADQRFFPHFL